MKNNWISEWLILILGKSAFSSIFVNYLLILFKTAKNFPTWRGMAHIYSTRSICTKYIFFRVGKCETFTIYKDWYLPLGQHFRDSVLQWAKQISVRQHQIQWRPIHTVNPKVSWWFRKHDYVTRQCKNSYQGSKISQRHWHYRYGFPTEK